MTNSPTTSLSTRIHSSVGAFLSNLFDFYDLMILSMVLALISKEFNLTLSQAGLLGTFTLIGCGISVFVIGWFSENYGRKKAIIYSVLGFSILTALIGFANSYMQILVLRLVAGIALGGIYTLAGTILNETWPPHLRGRATTIVWTSSTAGVLLASTLVAKMMPVYGWRSLFLFSIIGVLVAIYIAIFVPETEAWKAMKAQLGEGKKRLTLGEGLIELFSQKLRKDTMVGTMAAFLAQLSFWGFMFWLPMFLIKERGLGPAAVGGYIAFQSIGNFIGVPITGFIADKIGRKRTLLLVFALGTILIPLYASLKDLRMLFLMGPIMGAIYSYPGLFATLFPELLPTHIRSLGTGLMFNTGRALSAFGPITLGAIGAIYGLGFSIMTCGIMYLGAGIFTLFISDPFKREVKSDVNTINVS